MSHEPQADAAAGGQGSTSELWRGFAEPSIVAFDAAARLVAALVAAGVRDVVICPGSRSAPLAFAWVAAQHAGLATVHVRLDERSAGFWAIGHAAWHKAHGTSRAVAVVTTSGTAVANLHPAVLEAHHGEIPLLVLSADRPHEARGTGASQTTDQADLFGAHVRWSGDLPAAVQPPQTAEAGWRTSDLRALAARAIAHASGDRGGAPGPVQLNVAFREPLAPRLVSAAAPGAVTRPDAPERDLVSVLAERIRELALLAPVVVATSRPSVVGVADDASIPVSAQVLDAVAGAHRGVVIAGSGAGPVAGQLAHERGWPLLAEVVSGARQSPAAIAHYRAGADRILAADEPVEVAVVVGRPTLSRQALAVMQHAGEVVIVAAGSGPWPDAVRAGDLVLDAVPRSWISRRRAASDHVDDWSARWLAPGSPSAAVPSAAQAVAEAGDIATQTAAAVWSAAAEGTLVLGSSRSVRLVDEVAPAGPDASHPAAVISHRGLAGIDGTVSTALGVAAAARASGGGPVIALMGDLTFLHDASGLLRAAGETGAPVTIVVLNDGGGRIFDGLEHTRVAVSGPVAAAAYTAVMTTPVDVDVAALVRAYGAQYRRAEDVAAVRQALASSVASSSAPGNEGPAVTVIEVAVPGDGVQDSAGSRH